MVNQCVVRPVQDSDGRVSTLVAYLTLKEWTRSELSAVISIKKALKEILPTYMIPQKIVILPEFKTNTSGKIDRAALRTFHEEQTNQMREKI